MRVQFTIDDALGDYLQTKANELGFSVSSYVRYIVKKSLENKKLSKVDASLEEIERGELETVTLDEFKKQIEKLKKK